MVQLVRHPQTKERDTDRLHLNHRATSRLYSTRSVYETRTRPAVDRPRLQPVGSKGGVAGKPPP